MENSDFKSVRSYSVLIDTNVILTFLTKREDPFGDSIEWIMDQCARGNLNGYIAFHYL
jgi:rRNA-processing protein FCF1